MISFVHWVLDPSAILLAGIPAIVIALMFAGLVFSAIGFYRLVFFISIGYGFSIAAMASISCIVFSNRLAFTSLFHAALLAIYGLRLGIYLWTREFRKSFSATHSEIASEYPGKDMVRKSIVWIGVSLLYVIMISPLVFHLDSASGRPLQAASLAGVGIAFLGLVLESLADFEKSRAKKKNPAQFCSTGLYRVVRCPNYFGEIIVWVGSFVAAIPFYGAYFQRWIPAAAGLAVIVLIMLGSAKRLEAKQEKRYGRTKAYREYVSRTPVLIPFVQVYSLKKLKVTLG